MEVILDILYVYVVLYTLFFLALAIRNLNDKPFKRERRLSQYDEKENLAVVIYAHNNKGTLAQLINQLKLQDYPIDNFKVFLENLCLLFLVLDSVSNRCLREDMLQIFLICLKITGRKFGAVV